MNSEPGDGPVVRCNDGVDGCADNRRASFNSPAVFLERIKIDWTHAMGPVNLVNPLALPRIDQIHVVVGSPQAIPPNHDLV